MKGDILHGTEKVGSTKTGCFSGGIFSKDSRTGKLVKTNGFLFADVILSAMNDYLAMKSTQGVSESAAGCLLAKIQSTRKQIVGVEDDEYIEICFDAGLYKVRPSIHLLMSCAILCSYGILRKKDDCYELSKIPNRRITIAEKPLMAFLDPGNILMLKAMYELVHCGYYGSVKSHSRFEKSVTRVQHDISAHALVLKNKKRFVNLSQLLDFYGLRMLSRACDGGTVDFIDCSSAKLGLKMSSLMLSFLLQKGALSISSGGREVSFLGDTVEFSDALPVYNLSYEEMEFIEAIVLMASSSLSLDLSSKTVGVEGLISTAFCDCFEEYKDDE